MTTTRKRAPGGGRKPIVPGGTVRKTITLLVDDIAHLHTVDASTSKAVRELVRRDRELAGLAEDERLSRYYDWYWKQEL